MIMKLCLTFSVIFNHVIQNHMIAGIYHEEICLKGSLFVLKQVVFFFLQDRIYYIFLFYFFSSGFISLICLCKRAARICIRERQKILFHLVCGAFIFFYVLQENSSLPDYSYSNVFRCRLTSKGVLLLIQCVVCFVFLFFYFLINQISGTGEALHINAEC